MSKDGFKRRYKKSWKAGHDNDQLMNQEGFNVPKMTMRTRYTTDGQNPSIWFYHHRSQDKFKVLIRRFVIKRIGKKFDDVYSEFIKKYGDKYYNSKELFKSFFVSNKVGVYLDDMGVISRTPPESKNRDIIVYKKDGKYVWKPISRAWNAGRRVLIPLLGFHTYQYMSTHEFTEDDLKIFEKKISKQLTQEVIELFRTIEYFKNLHTGYWTWDLYQFLYENTYKTKVEKVIKRGTKDWVNYNLNKIQEDRKKYKMKHKPKIEYDKDLVEHNIKMKEENQ